MRKISFVIGLLILVVLIIGCVEQQDVVDENQFSNIMEVDGERFLLDTLIISFNGEKQNNLIADPKDENFREYLTSDIKLEIRAIDNMTDVEFSWLVRQDLSLLKIRYKEGITKLEKKESLDMIKDNLRFKWYTKSIEYDKIGHITE
ncbi:MAG: hypothetical protein AABW46_02395 [Nanoarchaeota archaeon]